MSMTRSKIIWLVVKSIDKKMASENNREYPITELKSGVKIKCK